MQAHKQQVRQEAIRLYNEGGRSIAALGAELSVSPRTLRNWIKRYRESGEAGLVPRYGNCGLKTVYPSEIMEEAVSLKKAHPGWGAPFILVKLADTFGPAGLPSARRLQQVFSRKGLQPRADRVPRGEKAWARRVFECVQVDAKEHLVTRDGRANCYLNFTDEHSGSELDAFLSPLCPDMRGAGAGGL